MSINTKQALAISEAFGRIPADLSSVCLWAFLGLTLTALAISLGFGAEIAEALGMAG